MNDTLLSEGDRFDAIVSIVHEPLLRYLARRAQHDAVDDLYVEVLTVLWRRMAAVPVGAEVPWALAVARRTLANQRRAHGRVARLIAKLALLSPGIDPGPEPSRLDDGVDAAMRQLRDSDREILRLFAWEQLSTGEIAAVLGISPNAAGVRLHRAKERFRRVLEEGRSKDATDRGQEVSAERKEARDER